MKKYILIGILFACVSHMLWGQILVTATETGASRTETELSVKNQFRRNLLIYLTNSYRDNLDKYYQLFTDSKQNINKDLIDELIQATELKTTRENGLYKCVMNLSQKGFQQTTKIYLSKVNYLALVNQYLDQYKSNNDIYTLLLAIDTAMLAPNDQTVQMLDSLVQRLQDLHTIYHEKYLVYNSALHEIVLSTPPDVFANINFIFGNQTVSKTATSDNEIELTVSFTDRNADFYVSSGISDIDILFAYDLPKTFRLANLSHSAFLDTFLRTFFTENAGKINLLYISQSKFYITSSTFKNGINTLKNIVKQKGWDIGNASNYTHRIVLSKVIVEEKFLNVGVYYIKAYTTVDIYDKSGLCLQSNKSNEIEVIDTSAERCRAKVDEQLMIGVMSDK